MPGFSALQEFNADMKEAAGCFSLTIRVKGIRRFRARLWLGMKLIQLAAWVLPLHTTIQQEA
jgi:hypothetical protein